MNNYRKATNYACDMVETNIDAEGELDFPSSTFADSVFHYSEHIVLKKKHLFNRMHPSYEQSEVSYWEIQPFVGFYLWALAELDCEFFDYLVEVCATNIAAKVILLEPLNDFAANALKGELVRPRKARRPRKKDWLAKSFLWSLTLELVEDFDLELSRNDESPNQFSACDAVAEALTVCGRTTKYTEIKNLMVHPDRARRRKEFEVSRAIYSRWRNIDAPRNALAPEFSEFWQEAAKRDVLDILGTFPPTQEKTA
ncbi:hypothetical protein [Shimia haliotis]|uniref:Uncharacterized protein n=1 Tax=Shimia haliotis TaxID=1280847 RepID=A0A1I4HE24_9RHOB|nr:hypothetical protein [Shimia haliotis]SFL39646.1 hypothetical protein SAMN04488036_11229 [Shimia haliotis]